MAVATITLESANSDWVVVSAPNDDYLADDIVLDTDPKGVYATGFKLRTQSGAFEPGGRVVGEQVPIREMVLPFWLTPDSRPRFQQLWGTPGNFQKVRYIYEGLSGPRSLTLRLSKEIEYTTEDGFDADINDVYHAVVSAIAVNPMFEGDEDAAEWVNPDDRFTVAIVGTGGTFPLTFTPKTGSAATTTVDSVAITATGGTFTLTFGGQTTTDIAYNAAPSAVQSALEGLSSVGAGNVTVTGSAGNYLAVFANVTGALTGSATNLTGTGAAVNITSGIPFNAAPSVVQSALEGLTPVGAGKVTVTGTAGNYLVVFAVGTNGVLTGSATNLTGTGKKITIAYAPNTGWFDVWNPTDQPLWPEWTFDPADQWQFPDFAFGQERKWGRAVDVDAARMIVTPKLTQMLSVMSDPFMDTYVNADLSNAAGNFNGVEPVYMVPPYTGTTVEPVICRGPAGSKVTLRQRRFWSAESGLEA
jgi:hypothetical protein